MMIERLRRALLPRYEGEQRLLHLRLVSLVLRVWGVTLAVWFGLRLLLYLTIGFVRGPTLGHELFSLVFSFAALGIGYLLYTRKRSIAAGYTLATAAWLYPTLTGLAFPSEVVLIGPVSVVAVFIAASIVGPGAGYLFAAACIGSQVAVFLAAQRTLGPSALPLDPNAAFIFIIVQASIVLFAAGLLHATSRHVHRAIERLDQQAAQMTELAHTDSLTGLANRRWLLELLEREFLRARRYQRPLSLIYIDLDGFKAVNDAFGHLFGDGLLRSAARSMQAVLRATDLLARIGGDEFAVLLPETDLVGADKVVAKLRRALLSTTRPYGAALPPLTFSAGTCQLRDADRTIDDLILRADEAQYLAKAAGRGVTRSEADLRRAPAAAKTPAAAHQPHGPDARD